MSTKKTQDTGHFILGLLAIAGILLFPVAAAGLILFALFGEQSSNHTYWKSVGDVRGENYSDPFLSNKKKS